MLRKIKLTVSLRIKKKNKSDLNQETRANLKINLTARKQGFLQPLSFDFWVLLGNA
jgi:phage-related protein